MLGKDIVEVLNFLQVGTYKLGGVFHSDEVPAHWTPDTYFIYNLASSTQPGKIFMRLLFILVNSIIYYFQLNRHKTAINYI